MRFLRSAPATGIGLEWSARWLAALAPGSDLDLVVIYEPHVLTDRQLNESPPNCGTRDLGFRLDSTSPSAPAPNARPSPTMICQAMGWLDVVLIVEIRKAHRSRPPPPSMLNDAQGRPQRLPELLGSATS